MSDEYEDDFVEEVRSPAHVSGAARGFGQLSVSAASVRVVPSLALPSTSSSGDAARVKELEARLETLEREVATSRVKLRRAGRGGAANGGDVAAAGSALSAAASSPATAAVCDIGPNTAREVPFSSLQLGEQISGGGFCLLYKSRWCGLDVAVKRIFDPNLTPALLAEFHNEVHLLANLAHPHIVQVLAQVSTPPSLCIVTEFLPRGSLYHVLHESQVDMSRARKIAMALQVAQALQFVHEAGIVHRDVKSHNALSDEFLRVKLCDFGMAASAKRLQAAPRSKEISGTPQYMAPELWQGQPASVSSDIYAYGILVGEIWSREVPWDGSPVSEVQRRVLAGERPKLALTVPRDIATIVKQCTAQESSQRPRDLTRIIAALSEMA